MVNVNDLKQRTEEFFVKFCKDDLFENLPKWSAKWKFIGSVPYYDKKGCYAHLIDEEVVYVGLGISDSNNGNGIGSRVSNYWTSTNEFINGEKKYNSSVTDITSIITLPFENDTFYLAAALEIYLIQNMNLKKNRVHSKSK
jgi:hypothetical protein